MRIQLLVGFFVEPLKVGGLLRGNADRFPLLGITERQGYLSVED